MKKEVKIQRNLSLKAMPVHQKSKHSNRKQMLINRTVIVAVFLLLVVAVIAGGSKFVKVLRPQASASSTSVSSALVSSTPVSSLPASSTVSSAPTSSQPASSAPSSAVSSPASAVSSETPVSSAPESSTAPVVSGPVDSKITPPESDKKRVAITFDDGPAAGSTDTILDAVERLGIKVTFFTLGDRIPDYYSRMQRTVALGCEVGTHSYDHANIHDLPVDEAIENLNKVVTYMKDEFDYDVTLYRPPYGSITGEQAQNINMHKVCWSVDSEDWRHKGDPDTVVNNVMSVVGDGDIVLMHEIYQSSADAFVRIAEQLLADGYELVTVSELLGLDGQTPTTEIYGSLYGRWSTKD